jgi:hypothetical protein
MARSTRNDRQRQSGRKVEQGLHDLADLALHVEDSIIEPGPAPDSLNLGHAGLRNECWSGASGRVSVTFRSGSAGLRLGTQRFRDERRTRTQLHHRRPPHRAEARFAAVYWEILTF